MSIENLVEQKNKLEYQIDDAERSILFYERKIAEHEQYGESLRKDLEDSFQILMPLKRTQRRINLQIEQLKEDSNDKTQ